MNGATERRPPAAAPSPARPGLPGLRRAGAGLRAGLTLLADLLFPRRCGLCGAFGAFLCEACAAALPPADGPRCRTCAAPVPSAGGCRPCDGLPSQPLDSLTAVFRFEGGARRLVHRLKYERLSALAEPMGRLMADALAGPLPDLIVPVPLHAGRRRERGFNQAELLAQQVARAGGVELQPRALVRLRATPSQVHQLGAAARAANVAGAFECRTGVARRSVLLVDDVATTGATLRACAAALRAGGAVAVHAAVFARDD